jgi:hypothetical protein
LSYQHHLFDSPLRLSSFSPPDEKGLLEKVFEWKATRH